MHASISPHIRQDKPDRISLIGLLRTHGSIWSWIALLAMVNLPLLRGEVCMDLLFLPDAVERGQWWRIFTYPLVHLSWYHLLLDAGGFLLLYTCLEEKRIRAKTAYLIGASAGSLLLSIAMDPFIARQGLSGLSGIAHGLMAITAMEMLRHKEQRTWGLFSLFVVVSKSTYELWTGQVLFEFMHMGLCGHPMATSHAGGVMGGLLSFAVVGSCRKYISRPFITGKKNTRLKESHQDAISVADQHHQTSKAQALLRRIAIVVIRIMYRVRFNGLDRIPIKGPAVMVCNHVSYVDGLIIASACNRPVHFVMHAAIYRLPVLNWIFRLAKVIPIDSGRKNPATLRQAFKNMAGILKSGGLICIFPEGCLTRNGRVNRFKPGIETIVRQTPVPVIPLSIRGLWGSFFSRKSGSAMRCWPTKRTGRIELTVGNGVDPHHVSAHHLQGIIAALHGDPA